MIWVYHEGHASKEFVELGHFDDTVCLETQFGSQLEHIFMPCEVLNERDGSSNIWLLD